MLKATDREVLRLAVPSIVSNITVPLLGLVDLAIAGHMASSAPATPEGHGGEAYIAAISVGSMIFNLIYWLMGFLRMGTSGMTAQAFGARSAAGVRLLLRRSLTLSLAIAAAFLALQWPLREAALGIIHPSATVRPLAAAYFDIVIWGAPAMLSLYSLNGWFIGMQDTRAPMTVAIAQNVVNILASLAFVYGLGMKVEGIALGTLVAQWSGVALAMAFLRRKRRSTELAQTVAVHAQVAAVEASWRHFFTVNRDIFLRTVCLVSVNLAFTSAGARQGDMLLAVNTLLMTFYTLFSYIMDGFAFAGEALAGKSYGARDYGGLRAVVRALLLHWGLPLALAFTLLYMGCGGLLLRLLTSDGTVVAAAKAFVPWTWLIPVAGFAAFVYDGIFIGMTKTRGMLASSLAASLTFFLVLAAAAVLPQPQSHPLMANHLLWLAFIAFLAMRGTVQHVLMRRYSRTA